MDAPHASRTAAREKVSPMTISRPLLRLLSVGAVLAAPAVWAQPAASLAPEALTGIYQLITDDAQLPAGLHSEGDPESIKGLPAPPPIDGEVEPDALKSCLPIGPFRMMALPGNKIEIAPGQGVLVMLFEDSAHGFVRFVHLDRSHPSKLEPTRMGDAVGTLDATGLTVETTGFDAYTWLNAKGARHSDQLRLTERIEPIQGGRYLAWHMTATDPKALKSPATFTRYYAHVLNHMSENICKIEG